MGMMIKETPNKITVVLKVTATAEFFDDEASEETVRCAIEQDLEDAGFNVDVALLREQEPVRWLKISPAGIYECSGCGQNVLTRDIEAYRFCHGCGKKAKWK